MILQRSKGALQHFAQFPGAWVHEAPRNQLVVDVHLRSSGLRRAVGHDRERQRPGEHPQQIQNVVGMQVADVHVIHSGDLARLDAVAARIRAEDRSVLRGSRRQAVERSPPARDRRGLQACRNVRRREVLHPHELFQVVPAKLDRRPRSSRRLDLAAQLNQEPLALHELLHRGHVHVRRHERSPREGRVLICHGLARQRHVGVRLEAFEAEGAVQIPPGEAQRTPVLDLKRNHIWGGKRCIALVLPNSHEHGAAEHVEAEPLLVVGRQSRAEGDPVAVLAEPKAQRQRSHVFRRF
mmetsp:Transcript_3130/g.12561  ORF Transcript_3130/g.12561 Transcript_3130/m.12561 type:complete len:295 (+) Transcript_3130:3589-4473(+)